MNKKLLLLLIIAYQSITPLHAQEAAAPNWAAKAQKSLLAVSTYDQEGKQLGSGTAFFISADGDAIADYTLFKGASSAIVTDASGQKHNVQRILGADDTYSLVKFRVADVKKPTPLVKAKTPPTIDAMVFILKYSADKIKNCPSARIVESKQVADGKPYYTLSYATDETYTSAPVFNSAGEWIGTVQPSMGLNGYALGAEFAETLTIKAITTKVNNMALDAIHMPKGLPDSAEEALVYIYIKSQSMSNEDYLDLLNQFNATYPGNAEGYSRRATLLIDLQRFDEAEADMQTFLKLSDDKSFAYSKMADIIYTKLLYQPTPAYEPWTYDLALNYIDKAIELKPTLTEHKLLKAQMLMSKHDYDGALSIFDAINNSPARTPSTLYAASLAHEGKGDSLDIQIALIDSALATFSQPLPAEAANYVLRHGQLNALAGKYREAVNDYNQYCFINGQKVNATFYFDRARLETNARMYQQALDDIDKAISMAPNTLAFLIEKCGLQLRVNQLDECIQTANQILKLAPDSNDAYRMMGYAQIQKGETDLARKNLEQAAALGDNTAKEIIAKYLDK
ncbi:MAG: hypothetical protein IJ139_04110 [Bacteroidaceae bacterium]|nr:hypothetical protein [Bacteroidaceae bacterium]MBQ9176034.1 hypothetical protein [Bacteroidaceae bacterium]